MAFSASTPRGPIINIKLRSRCRGSSDRPLLEHALALSALPLAMARERLVARLFQERRRVRGFRSMLQQNFARSR